MQISRKECEKFKMAINFDYDFSGWATKANVKCFDGLTIAPNAFKDCDGKAVPVVWNHDHSAPESVLGHALLQNRKEGVYAYVKLNDTSSGQTAKACVDNGDIDAMSIYATGIQKTGRTVMGWTRTITRWRTKCCSIRMIPAKPTRIRKEKAKWLMPMRRPSRRYLIP